MSSWFGGPSKADPADAVEMESRGGQEEGEEQHIDESAAQKLLPDMTEEEIDAMKVEKAKNARRQQLDIILNSETSIGATLAALKKSLAHYEKEKMDLYAKRQKYRIVVANYKGPVNDVKLEAIKQILHTDLPKLIDEMDDRIINGHIQVTGMERQLANLRTQRLKAERSYQRLFEPMPEGDLEGGPEYFSDDSSDIGKDATIDDVLRKFDPEYVDQAIPADAIDDTESESAEEDTSLTKSASNIKNLKINPRSSNSALPNQFNPSFPPAVLEARPSEDTIAIPLD